jgi:hypothetical protein
MWGWWGHKLNLETDAVVMVLRNLDVTQGLCHEPRLIVQCLQSHIIDYAVATGCNKWNRVRLLRITLTASDALLPFQIRWHQFPVRLSFRTAIKKSREQSFGRIRLFRPQAVFSHEQLYLAFSRVRFLKLIKVEILKRKQSNKPIQLKKLFSKKFCEIAVCKQNEYYLLRAYQKFVARCYLSI